MTRTVLITGASSGIGAEVARQLVSRGLTVLGTSRHPESVTDPIPGVRYLELDQNDPASIARCAEQAGAVDILINNAGESQMGPLEDTPMEVIEKLFATNVFGPIALTKAVLPGMRQRGRGTVVMVAHGGTIGALTAQLLDLPILHFSMFSGLGNVRWSQLVARPKFPVEATEQSPAAIDGSRVPMTVMDSENWGRNPRWHLEGWNMAATPGTAPNAQSASPDEGGEDAPA